jgi:sigma54-dependent transcription regulator
VAISNKYGYFRAPEPLAVICFHWFIGKYILTGSFVYVKKKLMRGETAMASRTGHASGTFL